MQISMGKGDIAVMLCSDREDEVPNGISFVKRDVTYPIAVDVDCDVTDEEIEKGTLGHITFSNPKSIDAVINQLTKLKVRMAGDLLASKDKDTNNAIESFSGEYEFLSNFYPAPLVYEGIAYRNSEAAFQAQKCKNAADRLQFKWLSPGMAKRLGRRVDLRPDWEEIKDAVMYEVCKAKFQQNPRLKDRLLATGDAYLEEGNTWNDTYWGVCRGVGENKLGYILMRLRDEFRRGLIR